MRVFRQNHIHRTPGLGNAKEIIDGTIGFPICHDGRYYLHAEHIDDNNGTGYRITVVLTTQEVEQLTAFARKQQS